MKNTTLYIFIAFCAFGNAFSQTFSPNQTYIYTRVFTEATSVGSSNYGYAQSIRTVQYFDALGRPKQDIAINAIKSNQDIVNIYVYDEDGKQTKQYLPIPKTSQTGQLHSVTESDINSYYSVPNAYSEVAYENSPLNRVVKKAAPGTDWAMDSGHTQNFEYGFNNAYIVKKYTATLNTATFENTLSDNGFHDKNTLYKSKITDEDGNISYEYKNGIGQTLLVRKIVTVSNGGIPDDGMAVPQSTTYADTYYVYNQYNQLAYIIPPLNPEDDISDSATREKLLYQYKYDALGRTIEKKLPGKGWEYFVYDKADRLVLSQDANMRTAGKWFITKSDKFGRVLYTGIVSGGTRESMQSQAENSEITEAPSTTGFSTSGITIYYTDVYFSNPAEILSVNYYDQYPAGIPVTRPANIYSQPTLSDNPSVGGHSTKTMLTATLVKNVEDNGWTKTLFWYDKKERLIGNHLLNHLGGYSKTEMQLDFPGNITESKVYHKRTAAMEEVVIKQRYVYSPQNLLLKHFHQVNNNPEEQLAFNQYNDLGQLISKQTGGDEFGNYYLQIAEYQYNIRGWLKGVNLDANGNVKQNQVFSYKINYNDALEGISSAGITRRYNGSIAEVSWSTEGSAVKRYGYVYDKLNRLTSGIYQNPQNPTSGEHSETMTYDLRGNIQTLKRFSYIPNGGTAPALIDYLQYVYNGNRITNIDDFSGNDNGYEGGGAEILYDDNGNMLNMQDKGISSINYNYLNLPAELQIDGGVSVNYLYRADGTKLKKTNITVAGTSTTKSTTEYLDGFQYLGIKITGRPAGDTEPDVLNTEVAMEREAFQVTEREGPHGPGPAEDTTELQFVVTSEGFYSFVENRYIYQYKDHLGNVRISYANNSNHIRETVDINDYYPFGMNHLNPNGEAYYGQGSLTNYKYNRKELQETGMYDYGWRQYMPDIGRWNGIDQLAEKYNAYSPYNYVLNNPAIFIDPDGRIVGLDGMFDWERKSWTNPDWRGGGFGNGGFGGGFGGGGGYGIGSYTMAYIKPGDIMTLTSQGAINDVYNDLINGVSVDGLFAKVNEKGYYVYSTGGGEYAYIDSSGKWQQGLDVVLHRVKIGNSGGFINWGGFMKASNATLLGPSAFRNIYNYGLNNELLRYNPNGAYKLSGITTKMRNGASYWKNNFVKSVRTQHLSKLKGLGNKAPGGILIVADVAMSGELKPSQLINGGLVLASGTGVGAVLAGLWFVADMGTGLYNYIDSGGENFRTLSDVIDDNLGTYEMYEGLY